MTKHDAAKLVDELDEAARDTALKGSMRPEMHDLIVHRYEMAREMLLRSLTGGKAR